MELTERRLRGALSGFRESMTARACAGERVTVHLAVVERLWLARLLVEFCGEELGFAVGLSSVRRRHPVVEMRAALEAAWAVPMDGHQDWWRVVGCISGAVGEWEVSQGRESLRFRQEAWR